MIGFSTYIGGIRQKIKVSPPSIVTCLLYIFFAVFLLYPLGYMLSRAFLEAGHPGITLRYFQIVLSSERYLNAFSNSLNLALAVTVIATLTAIPLAWISVAYKYPGKKFISLGLMLPLILPPFVGALGIRQILGRFGSLNLLLFQLGLIHEPIDWLGAGGPRGVALVQALHLYPIVYFNLVAALKAIDVTMIEAARITGASGFQVLWRIVFPLCLPALLASSIIVFVSSITDLGAPLLFEFRHALPVEIFNLLSDVREDPTGYALVTITCLVTMALFFLASSLDGSGAGVLSRAVRRDGDGRTARPLTSRSINRFYSTSLTVGFISILAISLLPHIGVLMLAISGKWAMSVLPETLDFSHFYEV